MPDQDELWERMDQTMWRSMARTDLTYQFREDQEFALIQGVDDGRIRLVHRLPYSHPNWPCEVI